MTQYEKLNFVNGSPPALNAATLNHIEDGILAATEGVTALDETVKIKPDFDDVYTVEEADDHFLSKYDAGNTYATKAELVTKANKETTYTKAEVDTALSGKLDNTAGSVTTDNIARKAVTTDKIANGAITALKIASGVVSGGNIAQNQISTNHLQSGAVTTDKLAEDVTNQFSELKGDLDKLSAATSEDVGKVLKAKTITDGKVVEWEFEENGGSTEEIEENMQFLFNSSPTVQ